MGDLQEQKHNHIDLCFLDEKCGLYFSLLTTESFHMYRGFSLHKMTFVCTYGVLYPGLSVLR